MINKDALILGQGYIGRSLTSYLQKQYPSTIVSSVSSKQEDYTNPSIFDALITRYKSTRPLVVINCAGYTGTPNVDACEENPDVKALCTKLNAFLPQMLATVCSKREVEFIHLSSGCIYNGYQKAWTEEDKPNFGMFNTESSFYSKTKHLGELLLEQINYGTVLRLRMPFSGYGVDRNLLCKLLKYDKLINVMNSMTCVEDLCVFIGKFYHEFESNMYDAYNVVNEGVANNQLIAMLMREHYRIKITNIPDWMFVDEKSLQLKANRSNCILNTNKIGSLDLRLPNVIESLTKCIKSI